jgi:hypothetical protein
MRIPSWVRWLAVFSLATPLSFFLWFEVAIVLFPNRTSDGHAVMPMGQAAFAFLAAPITGFLSARVVRRRWP